VPTGRACHHPVALAESFVDPNLYRGTAYKVSGWKPLGPTRGWKPSGGGFLRSARVPKQVWIRRLENNALRQAPGAELPALGPAPCGRARPRCTAKVKEVET